MFGGRKIILKRLDFDSYKERLRVSGQLKRINMLKNKKISFAANPEKALIVKSFFGGRYTYSNVPPLNEGLIKTKLALGKLRDVDLKLGGEGYHIRKELNEVKSLNPYNSLNKFKFNKLK